MPVSISRVSGGLRAECKDCDGRNLLYTVLHYLLEGWQTAAADIYIKKHFPHLTDSASLLRGMDLNLVHTNFFVDYPRLTAPNTKYVGGMHIKEGGETHSHLTGEVAEFVRDASRGIILFSLGYTGQLVSQSGFLDIILSFQVSHQRTFLKMLSMPLLQRLAGWNRK